MNIQLRRWRPFKTPPYIPNLIASQPVYAVRLVYHGLRNISKSSQSHEENFYQYTSGRWLWDEAKQLRDRYKRFNVSALKEIAATVSGANTCASMTKLAEGGSNKVFRLTMDNGSVVIARIPYPNTGPVVRAMASEVATMDFARTILDIPVPQVLSWSADTNNPVGSEYILMQEASGTQLDEVWDDMELESKLQVVTDVVAIEKKLSSATFTRHGSLYFKSDSFPGCQTAEITGNLSHTLKREIEERFVIGPVVHTSFWESGRARLKVDCGPWSCAEDYLRAISHREIEWLRQGVELKTSPLPIAGVSTERSVDAHIALCKKFNDIIANLVPDDKKYAEPVLWHWDLHAPNIFVDQGRISSIIDWQDVWAGPLFLQARHPRLVSYTGEMMLRLPDHYESLEDKSEKSRIRAQVEKSIIIWSYETDTREENPVLHGVFHLLQGRTRREIVEYAKSAEHEHFLPFRECLIRVIRAWEDFSEGTQCPIGFTADELADQVREADAWNANADFWASLSGLVSRDGWTSNENYEQARELFAQLREEGLKNLKGEERAEFERNTRWAASDVPLDTDDSLQG